MSLVTRRLRSLLIALAVLALSATAALAGRGVMSTPHHQAASQNQDGGQADESEAPEATDTDEDAPDAAETEAPEAPDASESDATDTVTGEHPDNHGKLVSEAAQGATPDGFDNHGAYVRTIAQDNHGHAGAATKHVKKH